MGCAPKLLVPSNHKMFCFYFITIDTNIHIQDKKRKPKQKASKAVDLNKKIEKNDKLLLVIKINIVL